MKHNYSISSRGFTLIELLVVIALIGVLLSMLLPSLSAAKNIAKITVCESNRRQLYNSVAVYVGDYNQRLPNRGISVTTAISTIWTSARWHSDTELQNDVRVGTVNTSDPGQRYWGLGCLWPGNYLGNAGRTLFCSDYICVRLVSGQNLSYDHAMVESNKTLILDDPTNWARTPSSTCKNTCWVSPWYLTEGVAPAGVAMTNLNLASTFDGRKSNLTFLTDGYFMGGTGWTNAMPHDRAGIVMMTTDGRGMFIKNPKPAALTDWGLGHPWDSGSPSAGYSPSVIGFQ